jgi:hypothetical protein
MSNICCQYVALDADVAASCQRTFVKGMAAVCHDRCKFRPLDKSEKLAHQFCDYYDKDYGPLFRAHCPTWFKEGASQIKGLDWTHAPTSSPTEFTQITSQVGSWFDKLHDAKLPNRRLAGYAQSSWLNVKTDAPTKSPSKAPTATPTQQPTPQPTTWPTSSPTRIWTARDDEADGKLLYKCASASVLSSLTFPTFQPTKYVPTAAPTQQPTYSPTQVPTPQPTSFPTTEPTYDTRVAGMVDGHHAVDDLHGLVDQLGLPTPLPTLAGGMMAPNGHDDDDGVQYVPRKAAFWSDTMTIRVPKKVHSAHAAKLPDTLFEYVAPTPAPTAVHAWRPTVFVDGCKHKQCPKINANMTAVSFSRRGMNLVSGSLWGQSEIEVKVQIRKTWKPSYLEAMANQLNSSYSLHNQAMVGVCKFTSATDHTPRGEGDWTLSSQGDMYTDGFKHDAHWHAPFANFSTVRVRYEPEQIGTAVKVKWWVNSVEQKGAVLQANDTTKLYFCVGAEVKLSKKLRHAPKHIRRRAMKHSVTFELSD